MKKQKTLSQSTLIVGLITLLLLSVPLIAMQFTDEVQWDPFDFVVMGMLLFGTGFTYMLILRHSPNIVYSLGATVAIGTTFLMIWANLAVGLIGDGANAGNLMYLGVLATVFIGTVLSRLAPKGMGRTMFAASGALVVHTGIALLTGMQDYVHSSLESIVGVNAFFATLFAVAGLLFWFTEAKQPEVNATVE